MIALIQRVSQARVDVCGETVGAIERGLLVLLCAEPQDTEALADQLVAKLLKLRVYSDAQGKMNLSLRDTQGGLLIVSQFTLYGDCSRGRRPSFDGAAPVAEAKRLYEYFVEKSRSLNLPTETGIFQASMQVHLENDGPVTLILESIRKSN